MRNHFSSTRSVHLFVPDLLCLERFLRENCNWHTYGKIISLKIRTSVFSPMLKYVKNYIINKYNRFNNIYITISLRPLLDDTLLYDITSRK